MILDIANDVESVRESTIALRRELHQIPELAFEEHRTAEIVAQRLEDLGLKVERGIGGTGVVAFLEGAKPGKTLMIRADMDALPIAEVPGRAYGSKIEGCSHACGHDVDMALLVSTAEVLNRHRDEIAGRVAFVFQPADEPQLGAKRMIEDGLLDKVQPDMVLCQHPLSDAPAGKVVVQPGPLWASGDVIKVTITGKPSTFAAPHEGVDCVLIAAHLITALYSLVHRESPVLEPVLFNVASIEARRGQGTTDSRAELEIRLAVFEESLRQKLLKRIEEIASTVVSAGGGSLNVASVLSIPPVVNDPNVTQAVANAARHVLGQDNIIQEWRNYFSDDVAMFMRAAPGCLFILGVANPEKGITGRTHSPSFDTDEDTLAYGVGIMSRAALELLQG